MYKILMTVVLAAVVGLSSLFAQDAKAPTATSLYNQGLEKIKAKAYQEGYDLLLKAIETADPAKDEKVITLAKKNAPKAGYYVGNGLRKAGKLDEALAVYQKSLELNPNSTTCLYGMGKVLSKKGDAPGAISAYLKAADITRKAGKAEKADKYVKGARVLCSNAYVAKDWDKTIATTNAFLETTEDAVVYACAAAAHKEKKDMDKAKELAGKAIATEGGDRNRVNYLAAGVYEASGDKTKAKELYAKIKDGKYVKMAEYKLGQL